MAINKKYKIRKRATSCVACKREYEDGEPIRSRLLFREGEYLRRDFCVACWENKAHTPALSVWTTIFRCPPEAEEKPLQKEGAEELLRRLIEDDDESHANTLYILAVMLERKKIFIENDVQHSDNETKIRVYEHRKTGETFLIPDPELKLSTLARVQAEVVAQLNGEKESQDAPQQTTDPQPTARNEDGIP